MSLTFYNTLNQSLETFQSLNGKQVSVYSCGPTVYGPAHIGNFRTFIFNDLLCRYLRFRGFTVNQVMNITDIDDKTIRGAEQSQQDLFSYTQKYIDFFLADMKILNICMPTHLPRATDYIEQMIQFIEDLTEKGYTYQSEGSTYFKIAAFADYGKLSKLNLEQSRSGLRYDTDEYEKEDIRDFVLWKRKKGEEPSWPAPFGEGRPGWHIECSTMSRHILGQTIDIHSGGVDLIFPHHENEIAQSEALNGQPFVRFWLHAEHLLVDNKKMSKSEGNLYTIQDLLAKDYSGREIRYLLLSAHYRKKFNFTLSGLDAARSSIKRIDSLIRRLQEHSDQDITIVTQNSWDKFQQSLISALDHDLNISEALASLFDVIHLLNQQLDKQPTIGQENGLSASQLLSRFNQIDQIFGFIFAPRQVDKADPVELVDEQGLTDQAIEELIAERRLARSQKDFARADAIRQQLSQAGITIEDTSQATRWYRR